MTRRAASRDPLLQQAVAGRAVPALPATWRRTRRCRSSSTISRAVLGEHGARYTARLAEIPSIVGIKEACGVLDQVTEVIARTPDDFDVYSGDDDSIHAAG